MVPVLISDVMITHKLLSKRVTVSEPLTHYCFIAIGSLHNASCILLGEIVSAIAFERHKRATVMYKSMMCESTLSQPVYSYIVIKSHCTVKHQTFDIVHNIDLGCSIPS